MEMYLTQSMYDELTKAFGTKSNACSKCGGTGWRKINGARGEYVCSCRIKEPAQVTRNVKREVCAQCEYNGTYCNHLVKAFV